MWDSMRTLKYHELIVLLTHNGMFNYCWDPSF
jgi:hypothetical protein